MKIDNFITSSNDLLSPISGLRFIIVLISFPIIIIIGCSATNTYTIYHDQTNYDMLEGKMMGEKVDMVLVNGEIITGKELTIEIDSTSWEEISETQYIDVASTGRRVKKPGEGPRLLTRTIATSQIDYITIRNNGKGAVAGAGTGCLVGAAAGVVYGFTIMDEKGMDSEEIGAAGLIVTVPLGSLVGTLLGMPIGAAIGGTDKYKFSDITLDSISIIPKSNEIIEKPIVNYIDVEVSSIETDAVNVFVEWKGKRIQLLRSEVVRRGQSGDTMFIKISEKLYESKFK